MSRFSLLALAALAAAPAVACRRIPPDAIGIRTMNVGGQQGVLPNDFDAGLYRSLWLYESWDTLPRSVQRIHFTNRSELRTPDDASAIGARTRDGDSVTVEAVVLFRIAEGKGHVVYRDSGPGDGFKQRARELAGPQIASAFATLRTEEIYKADERRKAYAKLVEDLRAKLLVQKYLDLIDVAITNVTYEPKYEEQLEKRKINDQKTELEKSLRERAVQQGVKDSIVQQTDNLVKRIQNELKNSVSNIEAANKKAIAAIDAEAHRAAEQIKADANYYRAKMEAEGSQAVGEAEAYAVDLQNKALGSSGQNWVAYQAALAFPVRSVQMSSLGIDWFNPISIAERLGAAIKAASPPPSTTGAIGAAGGSSKTNAR